jgi:hypothetical protein
MQEHFEEEAMMENQEEALHLASMLLSNSIMQNMLLIMDIV